MKSRFISVLSLSLFLIQSAHAVSISVYQPQAVRVLGMNLGSKVVGKSVGDATVSALNAKASLSNFTFSGDANYISAINGLGEKTETLPNGDLKAYGWCFTLNGALPDQAASQTKINAESDEIIWYYGSMSRISGQWQTNCVADDQPTQQVLLKVKSRH